MSLIDIVATDQDHAKELARMPPDRRAIVEALGIPRVNLEKGVRIWPPGSVITREPGAATLVAKASPPPSTVPPPTRQVSASEAVLASIAAFAEPGSVDDEIARVFGTPTPREKLRTAPPVETKDCDDLIAEATRLGGAA